MSCGSRETWFEEVDGELIASEPEDLIDERVEPVPPCPIEQEQPVGEGEKADTEAAAPSSAPPKILVWHREENHPAPRRSPKTWDGFHDPPTRRETFATFAQLDPHQRQMVADLAGDVQKIAHSLGRGQQKAWIKDLAGVGGVALCEAALLWQPQDGEFASALRNRAKYAMLNFCSWTRSRAAAEWSSRVTDDGSTPITATSKKISTGALWASRLFTHVPRDVEELVMEKELSDARYGLMDAEYEKLDPQQRQLALRVIENDEAAADAAEDEQMPQRSGYSVITKIIRRMVRAAKKLTAQTPPAPIFADEHHLALAQKEIEAFDEKERKRRGR